MRERPAKNLVHYTRLYKKTWTNKQKTIIYFYLQSLSCIETDDMRAPEAFWLPPGDRLQYRSWIISLNVKDETTCLFTIILKEKMVLTFVDSRSWKQKESPDIKWVCSVNKNLCLTSQTLIVCHVCTNLGITIPALFSKLKFSFAYTWSDWSKRWSSGCNFFYCSAGTTIRMICKVLFKESEDTKIISK